MQVEKVVGRWKQDILHEGRDLLGDRPGGIAGKCPVEVQAVERRRPPAGRNRRQVYGGYGDDSALDLARIETPDELAESDRAFVLVAMVAAFDQNGRARPVLYDGKRHRNGAPGVVVGR